MDRRAMIGHIAAKFDIKMDENDPAFIMVEMNRMALESAGEELESRMAHLNEKMTLSIGAMAGAIDEMNASAGNLVRSKIDDLNRSANNHISAMVKNAVEQSLRAAVAVEVKEIRKEFDVIAGNLKASHASKPQRSVGSYVAVAAVSGMLSALLTLGLAWWAVSSGKLPIDVRVDSASVAQTVLNGVKALPRTR